MFRTLEAEAEIQKIKASPHASFAEICLNYMPAQAEAAVLQKIVSGGQTGADRAALDWAIAHGIAHGGWCPAGRRAEDGVVPEKYSLKETPSRGYRQRTRWNVRDSDATLIVTLTAELTGGSLFTQQCAAIINRPCLHVYPCGEWREWLTSFLGANPLRILNVAGPRSSTAPCIEQFVHKVLDKVNSFSSVIYSPKNDHGAMINGSRLD